MQAIPGAGQPQSAEATIISSLIADAARKGADDVHIEPGREHLRVRYRIDGRMCYIAPLVSALLPGISAAVKRMCGMNAHEFRRPQDGECRFAVDDRELEVHASTLPASRGEIIILRLVRRDGGLLRLDALGLTDGMLAGLQGALARRQGLVLATGGRGSGKTTSLYAALSHLNAEDVSIATVEDRVEADLDGINQVPPAERTGPAFRETFGSLLRQSPDVVMAAELRDPETAEMACRAALTGTLVLSTLPAARALTAADHLSEMGLPPYLIGSSLSAVLTQRLVRRVCARCAVDYDPAGSLVSVLEGRFGSVAGRSFLRGAGCLACGGSGTRGRVGAFELLVLDEDLRRLISEGATAAALREPAAARGFRTLAEDAWAKALQGLIPPEEVVDFLMHEDGRAARGVPVLAG